jgi:hypothetical protein
MFHGLTEITWTVIAVPIVRDGDMSWGQGRYDFLKLGLLLARSSIDEVANGSLHRVICCFKRPPDVKISRHGTFVYAISLSSLTEKLNRVPRLFVDRWLERSVRHYLQVTRFPRGRLPSPSDEERSHEAYFFHSFAEAPACTSFICSPQQISECGMLAGQGQGFS